MGRGLQPHEGARLRDGEAEGRPLDGDGGVRVRLHLPDAIAKPVPAAGCSAKHENR